VHCWCYNSSLAEQPPVCMCVHVCVSVCVRAHLCTAGAITVLRLGSHLCVRVCVSVCVCVPMIFCANTCVFLVPLLITYEVIPDAVLLSLVMLRSLPLGLWLRYLLGFLTHHHIYVIVMHLKREAGAAAAAAAASSESRSSKQLRAFWMKNRREEAGKTLQ